MIITRHDFSRFQRIKEAGTVPLIRFAEIASMADISVDAAIELTNRYDYYKEQYEKGGPGEDLR